MDNQTRHETMSEEVILCRGCGVALYHIVIKEETLPNDRRVPMYFVECAICGNQMGKLLPDNIELIKALG